MSNHTLRHRSDVQPRPGAGQAGFTLAELMISLFVLTILLVAMLGLFDASNKMARAQLHVADMQQSLRSAQSEMIRLTRMAGRGGLPRGNVPDMIALDVRNNVADGSDEQFIAIANAATPKIVPGTDVLTVRGVFNTPIYHINPPEEGMVLDDPLAPTRGVLRVQNPIPVTGVPQDMQPLIDLVNQNRPEAILIASPLGGTLYAIVELDPGHADTDISNPDDLRLAFKITGGTHSAEYATLSPSGGFPADLRSVAYIGILEEHRFYIRQMFAVTGDDTSEPTPRLARARFFPGTEVAYSAAQLAEDIADNMLDLQVALAIDLDGNGIGPEDATGDEWLFNFESDEPVDPLDWNGANRDLYYARISTLARTDRADFKYVAEPIDTIEDHDYSELTVPVTDPDKVIRQHRRRLMQTTVDLRNL